MDTPPFWENPERFFSLPLKADSLLLIFLSSLCATVMHYHPILAVLTGAAISLLIVNYGLILVRKFNRQNRSLSSATSIANSVPGFASAFDFRYIKDSLALCGVLWLSMAPIVLLLNYVSGLGALIYALLALSILPSALLMLMHKGTHSGTRHASAPSLISIIKKMHLSYFSLVSYFALCFLSALITVDLIKTWLPDYGLAPLATLICAYLILALFSALAYVLLRHDSFSRAATQNSNREHDDKTQVDKKQRLDADLDIAVKDGNYDKAIKILEASLKGVRSDLRVHQLYTLLIEHKDLKNLEKRSHLFLELLLGRGQKLAAYELVELLRKGREKFLIYDIELSLQLAEVFYDMKEYKLILWLAQDLHTRFDPSPDLAKLYLLAAKTILSKSKTPEKALIYLQYVRKTFPNTDFHQHATRLIEHINSRD